MNYCINLKFTLRMPTPVSANMLTSNINFYKNMKIYTEEI